MADLTGVAVGDVLKLYSSGTRGRTVDVPVTRVGRKYLYITQYGRECPFRISNGIAADGYGHSSVRTPAQHAEAQRRTELLAEIYAGGLQPSQHPRVSLTTAQLEAVAAALRTT